MKTTDFPIGGLVDVVSRDEHSHPNITPPRNIKRCSRHGIKGQIRLKTESIGVYSIQINQSVASLVARSIC